MQFLERGVQIGFDEHTRSSMRRPRFCTDLYTDEEGKVGMLQVRGAVRFQMVGRFVMPVRVPCRMLITFQRCSGRPGMTVSILLLWRAEG